MIKLTNSIFERVFSRHSGVIAFSLISAVFYLMAYYSVSDYLPNAIPVHNDDYTNYSSAADGLAWSWIRPLSTWMIFLTIPATFVLTRWFLRRT